MNHFRLKKEDGVEPNPELSKQIRALFLLEMFILIASGASAVFAVLRSSVLAMIAWAVLLLAWVIIGLVIRRLAKRGAK